MKKKMGSMGNMTNVEKEINKHDLYAYKVSDTNQYAMIPGVTSSLNLSPHPKKTTSSPVTRSSKANIIVNEDRLRV